MGDEPDYYVDIERLRDRDAAAKHPAAHGRKWIGVRFDCCGVYLRVYRNAAGTAYEGRCPRCLRTFRARVGPDGTQARFFAAE
jgi:hypothetical protein